MSRLRFGIAVASVWLLAGAAAVRAQQSDSSNELARNIYKQLIEINTTDSVGSTTRRRRSHGQTPPRRRFSRRPTCKFWRPTTAKATWSPAFTAPGARKPILFICHLDVVEPDAKTGP